MTRHLSATRVITAIVMSLLLSAASAAPKATHPGTITRPDVRSSTVLVVDAKDSSVLFAQRDDAVRPIASITKLMTALVVLEGGQSLDEVITISREDRNTEISSASRLAVGTRLTRGELLHLALMSSENRAASRWDATIPVVCRCLSGR